MTRGSNPQLGGLNLAKTFRKVSKNFNKAVDIAKKIAPVSKIRDIINAIPGAKEAINRTPIGMAVNAGLDKAIQSGFGSKSMRRRKSKGKTTKGRPRKN